MDTDLTVVSMLMWTNLGISAEEMRCDLSDQGIEVGTRNRVAIDYKGDDITDGEEACFTCEALDFDKGGKIGEQDCRVLPFVSPPESEGLDYIVVDVTCRGIEICDLAEVDGGVYVDENLSHRMGIYGPLFGQI